MARQGCEHEAIDGHGIVIEHMMTHPNRVQDLEQVFRCAVGRPNRVSRVVGSMGNRRRGAVPPKTDPVD